MLRSFNTDVAYAIKPGLVSLQGEDGNETQKLYRTYCRAEVARNALVKYSFADYARKWQWNEKDRTAKRRQHTEKKPITAIGIRFSYEMLDNFIGEFATMFWPHSDIKTFTMTASPELMQYTKFYRSTMEFLTTLRWESESIIYAGRQRMAIDAFPPGMPAYTEKDQLVYYV